MVSSIPQCYTVLAKDPTDSFDNLLHINAHRIGWLLSGVAALVATTISVYLIIKHSQYYYKPSQQRYIIRIILMVPVYSIISWFSYIFYREAPYYELVRDTYEAFVIASFFILLVNYIGDRPEAQREALQQKQGKRQRFPFPFSCFMMQPNNYHFLQFLKYGILQYVVIRPIATIVSLILFANGLYCPENMNATNPRLYISAINFASVSVAMYALIVFYVVMAEDLKPYKPFQKFLVVKLVIFFSFWQDVAISVLAHYHVIKETDYWTADNIRTGLVAILICFEMIGFAIMHTYAFPYREYRPNERVKTKKWWKGLVDALNPIDFIKEIWYGAVYMWNVLIRKQHKKGRVVRTPSKKAKAGALRRQTSWVYGKHGELKEVPGEGDIEASRPLTAGTTDIHEEEMGSIVEEEETDEEESISDAVAVADERGRVRFVGGAANVDMSLLVSRLSMRDDVETVIDPHQPATVPVNQPRIASPQVAQVRSTHGIINSGNQA